MVPQNIVQLGKTRIKYSSRKGKVLAYLQLIIRRLQRQYNILSWFCKGPSQTCLLLIDKCWAPKISYKIEATPNCIKCEGVHHPLLEIGYYNQFLYDPTSANYMLKIYKNLLKLKKSRQTKKDANKTKELLTKNQSKRTELQNKNNTIYFF